MLTVLIIYIIVAVIITISMTVYASEWGYEPGAGVAVAVLLTAFFTFIGVYAGWVWTDSENAQNHAAWEFHSVVAEGGDVSDVAANDRYQYLNQTRAEDFLHGLSISDDEVGMLSGELREHRAAILTRDLSNGDYKGEPLGDEIQALALKAVTARYKDRGNCFYRATLQTLIEWHEQKTKKESWLIEETQDTLIANDPDLNIVDCPHTFERYEMEQSAR